VARLDHPTGAPHSSGATIGRSVRADWCRVGAASGEADRAQLARAPVDSVLVGRALADLGQARRARALVHVTTIDARPGVTAMRVTVARRLGATEMMPSARPDGEHRSGLAEMIVTIRERHRAAPVRPASSYTVATRSSRRSGPAVPFAA